MSNNSKTLMAFAGVLVIAGALLASLAPSGSGGEAPPAAPSDTATPPPERPEPADNSYCLVCHANYEEEDLTTAHQPVGVGCEKCHGESIKHSGDEDGITPPDKMFAKSEVTAFCMTCHEQEKLGKQDEHKEFFKARKAKDTCSDCHAEEHRLKVRTRIWDKKTGKLVKDDGVRMMEKDSPATEGAGTKPK